MSEYWICKKKELYEEMIGINTMVIYRNLLLGLRGGNIF